MRNSESYADAIYATAYAARLCPDVLLRAFGTAYPAHRIILASQSAYFATLLRWVSWSTPRGAAGEECLPSHDLVLGEEVTQRGFEWLLEYFYASPHLGLTSDNVFDVLASAHYLGVTAVQTACVEFLSQRLDPTNFANCLAWATGAHHGEASDMLAAACRRVLALRLPRDLPAWAPALTHIEPHTLLDILSSDHLAVPDEYGRYELVREVAEILVSRAPAPVAASAASAMVAGASSVGVHAAGLVGAAAVRGAEDDGDAAGARDGASQAGRGGVALSEEGRLGVNGGAREPGGPTELQRLLGSALNLADEHLARHLHLARSCPAATLCSGPVATPMPAATAAAAAPTATAGARSGEDVTPSAVLSTTAHDAAYGGCGGGSGSGSGVCSGGPAAVGLGTSPSDCACMDPGTDSSQTSSGSSARSWVRSGEPVAAAAAANTDGFTTARHCAGDSGASPNGRANTNNCHGLPQPMQSASAVDAATAAGAAAAVSRSGADAPAAEAPTSPADPALADSATATGAAACALLLLQEAVRYEHLSVPQLMALQAEGRVPPQVLHAALWERARLEHQIATAGGSGGAAGCTTATTRDSADARSVASSPPPPQQQRPTSGQPFRICWRLPCLDLQQLQPEGMLQSETYQYAGALWHVRVCRSGAAPAGQLGLFVGRQLVPASAPASRSAGDHRRWDAAMRPQRNQQQERQQEQQRQHQQHASPVGAFVDRQPSLRSRCRVSVYQSDNAALQGRLCLGDSGDFVAEFVAGGYFGQAKMLSRTDVSGLPDSAEVFIFVSLLALVGGAKGES